MSNLLKKMLQEFKKNNTSEASAILSNILNNKISMLFEFGEKEEYDGDFGYNDTYTDNVNTKIDTTTGTIHLSCQLTYEANSATQDYGIDSPPEEFTSVGGLKYINNVVITLEDGRKIEFDDVENKELNDPNWLASTYQFYDDSFEKNEYMNAVDYAIDHIKYLIKTTEYEDFF